MNTYGASKLANILFTIELADRLAGTGVTANSLHPGIVSTGIGQDGDTSGMFAIGAKLIKPFILTAKKGAATSIYLASDPSVEGVTGKYFVKRKPVETTQAAQDKQNAKRLWDVSAELVGL
jgi:NAD(P)-dependent dehydrogenase (short-subunit alcohol dehydrogenase family)